MGLAAWQEQQGVRGTGAAAPGEPELPSHAVYTSLGGASLD